MEFFKRLAEILQRSKPFRQNRGLGDALDAPKDAHRTNSLVKSKPQTLEERYRLVEDDRQVEGVFKRVAGPLLKICEEISANARTGGSSRVILRELGVTEDRRGYLFMKPMNEYGWLMERSGAGWRISRAEKIVGQNIFLRSDQDPWDVVTIWNDPVGECLTRVRSLRFGRELMTLAEYERRLGDNLRDLFMVGAGH